VGGLFVAAPPPPGHEVTAFTRAAHGDVTADRDAVARALRGQDAVISALGRGKSPRSKQLMSRAMNVILPAMEREGVPRLIVLSSFGVGESLYEASLPERLFFRLYLRHVYLDKEIADDFVAASALDWTIVRATRLTDGPRAGRYQATEHLEPGGKRTISRADVAEFLVRQLADRTWVRKTVVISD
jgi:putative NADH-flavin reductase